MVHTGCSALSAVLAELKHWLFHLSHFNVFEVVFVLNGSNTNETQVRLETSVLVRFGRIGSDSNGNHTLFLSFFAECLF